MNNNRVSVFEKAYCDFILECEGGCAGGCVGGDCGGAVAPSGAGIGSGDVLGSCDHSTPVQGYMGGDCFHMPFPAMPVMMRYGWTTSGRKSKKKSKKGVAVTIPGKNPYAAGMKILKDSKVSTSKTTSKYSDSALITFKALTNGKSSIYSDVLYLNEMLKLAWRVDEDGVLYIYKSIESSADKSVVSIRCMKLNIDDTWTTIGEYGKFSSRDEGFDIIRLTCMSHREKLVETEIAQYDDSVQSYMKKLYQITTKNSSLVKSPVVEGDIIYIDVISGTDQSTNPKIVSLCEKLKKLAIHHHINCSVEYEFHPYGKDNEAFRLNSIIIEFV